jgi:hypothetical protein
MKKFVRILAFLLATLVWQSAAHADLDDIRRAAEAGNAEAQLELGILFQYGFRYKDNEIPALTWYILAANQGNAKAAKLRDALKATMSEKDVAEAMDQAAKFKPTGLPPAPAAAPEVKQPAPAVPPAAPAPETVPPSAPTAPETQQPQAQTPEAAPSAPAPSPAPEAPPTK